MMNKPADEISNISADVVISGSEPMYPENQSTFKLHPRSVTFPTYQAKPFVLR